MRADEMPEMRLSDGEGKLKMRLSWVIVILMLAAASGCSHAGLQDEEKAIFPESAVVSYQQEEIPESKPVQGQEERAGKEALVMFHNNMGSMCLSQLEFLEEMRQKCPSLEVQEMLTTNPWTMSLLEKYKSGFDKSMGVSSSFKYLPITFINNHAYSGYNAEIGKMIEDDIMEVCK